MSWKEILMKPKRLLGLLIGIYSVTMSIFKPISHYIANFTSCKWLAQSFFATHYFDLVLENIGWIVIVYSLRELFWKIKTAEYKKFIPLAIIFFVTIFVYTIARQLKDTLVIPYVGTEGAQACKIMILFIVFFYQTLYYSKIIRNLHESKWIFAANLPVIGYFSLFAFFLMNNPKVLPSIETIEKLKQLYPAIARTLIFDLFRIWPNVLYYIFAEIYAVSVTMVFFWQIANRYINSDERLRFLGALMIVAQIASLDTGLISTRLAKAFHNPVSYSMGINSIIIVLTGLMFLANQYLFKVIREEEVASNTQEKKKDNHKMSISETIKKHPKAIFVALLTVCYGLSTLLVEAFWKDKIKMLANIKAVELKASANIIYGKLNGEYITFQSRLSIIFALIVSNVLPRLSWILLATITPFVMLFGSLFAFGPMLFPNFVGKLIPINLVEISFWAGFIMLSLFKALKYNAFDISKESYVSSKDNDAKREIKNLEGAFGRVGKSGSAIILYLLLVITGENFSSPLICWILFIICMLISIVWILADFVLYKDLNSNKKNS